MGVCKKCAFSTKRCVGGIPARVVVGKQFRRTSTFTMAHILVLDDDLSIRQIVALILTRAGHSVTKAADGAEGAALLRARSFDLVITDLAMPGVDGVETIVGLRRDLPDLPIIAMSGASDGRESLRIAGLLGADCTLQKPFGTGELLRAVDQMLRAGCGERIEQAPSSFAAVR